MGRLAVVCETDDCPMRGSSINIISNIEDMLLFIEGWRPEPEDVCPVCGEPGVLSEPEDE